MIFGRETNLGIRVVLKQYKTALSGMHRELKVFTELERIKNGEENKEQESGFEQSVGLPILLSYAISSDNMSGEILMTNGGRNLNHWQRKITKPKHKMLFALAMAYYCTKGLQQIHSFGYAHSDLKMDNVCARLGSDGRVKFTLIDFGVVTKLNKIG